MPSLVINVTIVTFVTKVTYFHMVAMVTDVNVFAFNYILITNLMRKLLFIHIILIPLHVSSHKCSSSGGHIVYMQRMVPSLSTGGRGGRPSRPPVESDGTVCCMYTV
jgi:hypothetical protein